MVAEDHLVRPPLALLPHQGIEFRRINSERKILMQKKRIAAFLDGRPGHEKQTYGIIASLKSEFEIELVSVPVERTSVFSQMIQFFRLIFPVGNHCTSAIREADLLIGTGSSTHLPMLLCKKHLHIPAVTCMSPTVLIRKHFDLCFVPEHDGIRETGNIRLTLGAPNLGKNHHEQKPDKGLIAIGGKDEHSHTWNNGSILQMVESIIAKEADISWTITSSPRTPDETAAGIANLVQHYENASFYDFSKTAKGWIEEQYHQSSYVWVTSDSISMIFEALSAGCHVGILPMRWRKVTGKFCRNETVLIEKKLVVTYEEWLNGIISWPETQSIDESKKCAQLIKSLWRMKN